MGGDSVMPPDLLQALIVWRECQRTLEGSYDQSADAFVRRAQMASDAHVSLVAAVDRYTEDTQAALAQLVGGAV